MDNLGKEAGGNQPFAPSMNLGFSTGSGQAFSDRE
jgi:hypothetical protein